jgi:hypothetical protein
MAPAVQGTGLLTEENPLMMTGRHHLPRRVLRHDVRNPTTSGPRWPCREAAGCGDAAACS